MGHIVKFKDRSRMMMTGWGGSGVAGELVFNECTGSLWEDVEQ